MALVTANQFQLVPEISRAGTGFLQGQQIRSNLDARQLAQTKAQATQFTGPALAGDEQALTNVAQIDPARAQQIQSFLQNKSEAERTEELRENEVLTRTAIDALSLPPNQQRPFLQRKREEFIAAGRDTSNIDRALSGNDQVLQQSLTRQARQGQTIANVAKQLFPTQTTLEKNLVAAGLKPGTPEFQAAALKGATKPATSITIGGGKKEQEKLAESRVAQLTRFQEQAEVAIEANQSLDVLENIDVDTGALEPAKQGLAAFGKAFGLDTSGIANVSAGEAFNAEAKRLVLAVKASQKGPQTDKDENTIAATVARLGNTQVGNQFIVDSAKSLNNRKIERADFYNNFLDANDTLKDANKAWSKFKRSTPMISAKRKTSDGLPVFFFKFENDVRAANPDATRQEIIEAWREFDKRPK